MFRQAMCDMKRSSSNMVMTFETFFTQRTTLAWFTSCIHIESSFRTKARSTGATSSQKRTMRSSTRSEIEWPNPGNTSRLRPVFFMPGSSAISLATSTWIRSSASPWIANSFVVALATSNETARPLRTTNPSTFWLSAFRLCAASIAPWLKPPMIKGKPLKRLAAHSTVSATRSTDPCGGASKPSWRDSRMPAGCAAPCFGDHQTRSWYSWFATVGASGRTTATSGIIPRNVSASETRSSPRT
mmetsp:Transcript_35597/g.100061  ORF Transcript_35597/g.100061 Transcript_35597/m.100061 type:complete len:243 (+) Transcript_35597:2001-2729(+)